MKDLLFLVFEEGTEAQQLLLGSKKQKFSQIILNVIAKEDYNKLLQNIIAVYITNNTFAPKFFLDFVDETNCVEVGWIYVNI